MTKNTTTKKQIPTKCTYTKMIRKLSKFVLQKMQIQDIKDKRDDNTGHAYKPKKSSSTNSVRVCIQHVTYNKL